MKTKRVLVVAMVTMVMLLALTASMAVASGPGEPQNGKPVGWQSQTFYSTALTTTATRYTSSPLTRQGLDISKITAWSVAEVFVTADVSGTATVTVTPQLSNDAINWVDADFTYPADSIASVTSIITSTGLTTATTSLTGSTALATGNYQVVLRADQTAYKRVTLAGDYLRFKIESAGTVTPTVRVTLKNYQ